eukprot:scaffold1031_cov461-Prasinococcus_capsulatus_cf.AAC.12
MAPSCAGRVAASASAACSTTALIRRASAAASLASRRSARSSWTSSRDPPGTAGEADAAAAASRSRASSSCSASASSAAASSSFASSPRNSVSSARAAERPSGSCGLGIAARSAPLRSGKSACGWKGASPSLHAGPRASAAHSQLLTKHRLPAPLGHGLRSVNVEGCPRELAGATKGCLSSATAAPGGAYLKAVPHVPRWAPPQVLPRRSVAHRVAATCRPNRSRGLSTSSGGGGGGGGGGDGGERNSSPSSVAMSGNCHAAPDHPSHRARRGGFAARRCTMQSPRCRDTSRGRTCRSAGSVVSSNGFCAS